jgi:diacylglycerol kinase (ATP)
MKPATPQSPRRALIIANLLAGTTTEALLRRVGELTSSSLPSVSLHRTTHRGDATDTVRHALQAPHPPDLVITVGGDGTVREVVEAMTGSTAAYLAIVPGGTGNSGYRMLWGERPWEDALGAVLGEPAGVAMPRRLDLAGVAETGGLVFLGACSGLVAETLITAHSVALKGRRRYAQALVDTAAAFTPYLGRVTVDGDTIYEGGTVLANVGGGRHRGGQYLLLPYSQLDDGLLDVCVIGDAVRPTEVPDLILTGDHIGLPGVFYARGRRVTVERLDGHPLCFECDGELHQDITASMTLEVMPRVLPVWGALVTEPFQCDESCTPLTSGRTGRAAWEYAR